jgi:hypothetical protein
MLRMLGMVLMEDSMDVGMEWLMSSMRGKLMRPPKMNLGSSENPEGAWGIWVVWVSGLGYHENCAALW